MSAPQSFIFYECWCLFIHAQRTYVLCTYLLFIFSIYKNNNEVSDLKKKTTVWYLPENTKCKCRVDYNNH